jgi:hypothetical protein
MAGLDPAIQYLRKKMDARVKPAHDIKELGRLQCFHYGTGNTITNRRHAPVESIRGENTSKLDRWRYEEYPDIS